MSNNTSQNLISFDEVINLARLKGVNFGKGDPYNRIRYYIKIGLLPRASRKSFNGLPPSGALPIECVDQIVEIAGQLKIGKSIQTLLRESKYPTAVVETTNPATQTLPVSDQVLGSFPVTVEPLPPQNLKIEPQFTDIYNNQSPRKEISGFGIAHAFRNFKSIQSLLTGLEIVVLVLGGVLILTLVHQNISKEVHPNISLDTNHLPAVNVPNQTLGTSIKDGLFSVNVNTNIAGLLTASGGISTGNANIDAGSGQLTAGNVIYGIKAGTNVTVSGGQTPTISVSALPANITGTVNRITTSGSNVDISSNYSGQSSISVLGTITGGTWQATPITVAYINAGSCPANQFVQAINGTLACATPPAGGNPGFSQILAGTNANALLVSGSLAPSGGTITANALSAGTYGISVTGTAANVTGIVAVANGGTGASTAAGARGNLGAAAAGVNNDITSLTGLTTVLPVSEGGTGAGTLGANGILQGNGTSAVSAITPGVLGTVLVSNGTTASFTTLTNSSLTTGTFSNITGVGTLVAGGTGAGFTVALSTATVTGTLADARLSTNVPLLNATNAFTSTNSFIAGASFTLKDFTNNTKQLQFNLGNIAAASTTTLALPVGVGVNDTICLQTSNNCATGAPTFASITSGTNTIAAMVVGNGASFSTGGTGTASFIASTQFTLKDPTDTTKLIQLGLANVPTLTTKTINFPAGIAGASDTFCLQTVANCAAGAPNFGVITTGTNTLATMTVGGGASIILGGGIIEASKFKGSGSTTDAVDLQTAEVAGTLGVGNGGTGTTTTFTQGSVVFAGASGIYSQDNANFFYDGTNHFLGLGNAVPATRLDVTGLTLTTNPDLTVGTANFTTTVSKNDINVRTFYGVKITPTLSPGAANTTTTLDALNINPTINATLGNASTTLNLLNLDTTNTATNGVTTNLIKASYGGSQKFVVDSFGNIILGTTNQGTISAGTLTASATFNLPPVAAGTYGFVTSGNLDNGLTYASNKANVKLDTLTASTATTSSKSGMEITSNGLTLLLGCVAGSTELLKWNGTAWVCAVDNGTGAASNLQGAYAGGNTITTTTGRDIAFTLPASLPGRTSFTLTNSDTTAGNDFYVNNANISGTTTNGIKVEQTAAGALTNAINVTQTAGSITNGLSFNGTFTNLINSTNFTVSNAGVVTLAGAGNPDIATPAAATATALTIKPGTSSGALANGAALTLSAGDGSGTTTVTGGLLSLTAGSATGGLGTKNGGSVSIDAGTGVTANGNINIGTTNALGITIGRTGGGALSLNGGAASNFSTGAGNINLQPNGALTGSVQIGGGGAGSTTPDLLVLDKQSTGANPTGVNGALLIDSTGKFNIYENGNWKTLCNQTDQSCGVGSGSALSSISAATTGHTINSGDWGQVWNWSLTTASNTAFTFGENIASTATGSPYILSVSTLASSTAAPFNVAARGNKIIDTTSTGGITIGNATSAQAVTIDAGTANLNIGNSNSAKIINIGTGSAVDTIHIGDGGGGDVITLGTSTASFALTSTGSSLTSGGVLSLAGNGSPADITTLTAGNNLTILPLLNSAASGAGGGLSLIGGRENGTGGTGGSVSITGGVADGVSGTRTGGSVTINGGSGLTTNGSITIGNTNTAGVTIASLAGSTLALGNTTGVLTVNGGGTSSITNTSGNLTIATVTSGNLALNSVGTFAFSGTNASLSTAGVYTLAGAQNPDITTPGAATANGITIKPGISTGNSSNGAGLTLTAGDGSGTTTVIGGTLSLNGGSATGGLGSRTGGNVSIDAGTGATANGTISIGGTNAASIGIGRTGITTTVTGGLALTGTAAINTSGSATTAIGNSGTDWNISTTGVLTLGRPSTTQGSLVLDNISAFTTTLKSSNTTTASVAYILPTADGAAGTVLSTDGGAATGVLSWVVPGGCTTCIVQVPTGNTANTASNNVISPTAASVIGLTINGTTNAVTAADVLDVVSGVNTGLISTNGILFNQNSTGTTTNGINITRTAGTLTNGLVFNGTIGTDITSTDTNKAITITAKGTGALTLNSGASGALSLVGNAASSFNYSANVLTITSGAFDTTGTGINSTAIGATTASTGAFTTLTSSGSTTLGTSTSTNTFGSGASSTNTIGSATTPGVLTLQGSALTLHGAATLDNTFTVSGSNLTSLGGNLTVTGTAWTATPTISGLITASSGVTIAANQNLTMSSGTGVFTQTYTSGVDATSARVLNFTNTNGAVGIVTVNGLSITPTGTATAGTNNLNSINFASPLLPNSNNFYGLNFATGYNALLRYNGSNVINGTGIVQVGFGGLGADITPATAGEILYSSGTTAYGHLATAGAPDLGKCLKSGGAGAPSWSSCPGGSTASPFIDVSGTIHKDTCCSNEPILFTVNAAAAYDLKLNTSVEPTADLFQITTATNPVATTSTNAASIIYQQGTNVANITGSALDITLTPSGDSGDTIKGINFQNVTGATGPVTAISIGTAAGTSSSKNAISIGSGWNNQINGNSFSVDGTGNLTAGTYNTNTFSSTALTFGGTNDTITSVGTLTITPAGALIVGATTQNLTLQGATTSLTATSAGVTNSLVFTTPAAGNKTITIPNETGTICTSAATSPANCTNFAPATGSTAYLAKNANDTSSAAFVGNLYGFTNTSPGAAGVLKLTNSGTLPTLDVEHAAVSSNNELVLVNSGAFTQTITVAVANARFNQFLAPTIAGDIATRTVTNAATLYIDQPPIAGTNAAITNPASLLFGNAVNQIVLVQGSANDTVGRNLAITAGAAGSATVLNSAYAGGNLNLTAGAASFTGSGTAAGGDIVLTGGAGANGGATGKVGFFNAANNFISNTGALTIAGDLTVNGTGTANFADSIAIAANKNLSNASGSGTVSWSSNITTGNVIAETLSGLATTTVGLNISQAPTYNGGAGITNSGNLANLSRSLAASGTGTALSVTGAVLSVSDNCSPTAPATCANSANVLSLTQSFATASGAVLAISNSGTGNDIVGTGSTWSISKAGSIVGVGVNSGTGLIQGTGGLTLTGTTSINTSGSTNTSIGSGSNTGTILIGNSTSTAIKLGKFITANGVIYVSATDGTVSETAASTGAQCLQTSGAGTAPIWGSCATGVTVPLDSITAAVGPGTHTIDNTNLAQTWNWSTLATQTAFALAGGTAQTSGTLLSLNGTYAHIVNNDVGNLASVSFTDASIPAVSVATTTNGINIATTISQSASFAGTKNVNAINIATPTVTCTSSVCNKTAINIGSGWDTILSGTTAGTNLIGFTNFTVTTAGAITAATSTNTINGIVINSGALTSVSSLDTIATSATALTFAGAGTISATGANALALQGGASGALTLTGNAASTWSTSTGALNINAGSSGLNLQTDGSIDVNIAGGSGATGCTVTNSNGNLTCSGAIATTATSGTQGWWTRGNTAPTCGTAYTASTLCPSTANDVVFIQGANGATDLTIGDDTNAPMNGTGLSMKAWRLTSGYGIRLTGSNSIGSQVQFTGAMIKVDPDRRNVNTGSVVDDGNYLALNRTYTTDTGGFTHTSTANASLVSLTSNCTALNTNICVDHSSIININQQLAVADAPIINITNAGVGIGIAVNGGDTSLSTPNGGLGRYENLLLYSEDFSQAAWTLTTETQAQNVTAPNGVTNGATTLTNGTCGLCSAAQTVTGAAISTTYTFSVWLKAGTSTTATITLAADGTGTPTTSNAVTLTSGWQRFSVSNTTAANSTTNTVKIINTGVNTTGTILAWGGQLEKQTTVGVYTYTSSVNQATTLRGSVQNITNTINLPAVASGTVNGLNINGVTAAGGTENGINIGSITPGAGTQNAINIGTGWNKGLNITSNTSTTGDSAVNLGYTSANSGTPTQAAFDLNLTNSNTSLGNTLYGMRVTNANGAVSVTNALLNLSNSNTNASSVTNGILFSGTTAGIYDNGINFTAVPSFTVAGINSTIAGGKLINNSGTAVQSSGIVGVNLDFNNTFTALAGSTLSGFLVKTPVVSQTTAVTYTVNGFNLLTAGALTQGTAAGTINWSGAAITLPVITTNAGAGTINAAGLNVTIPNTPVTQSAGAATAYGINISGANFAAIGTGPASGTLYGINIAGFTTPNGGTKTGINIGMGWDSDLQVKASGAFTQAAAHTGVLLDYNTTFTGATGQNLTGIAIKLPPALTYTSTTTYNGIDLSTVGAATHTTGGVYTFNGFNLVTPGLTNSTNQTDVINGFVLSTNAAAITQDTAAGTINWSGVNLTMPPANVNFAGSTVLSDGIKIAASGLLQGTTGTGNVNGVDISMGALTAIATGGTTTGVNIAGGSITAGSSSAGTTNGIKLTTAALALTTATTQTINGLNLSAAGALSTGTAAGTVNWAGVNLITPNITAGVASSTITSDGLKIKVGTTTLTAGTTAASTGVNIDLTTATITTGGSLTGLNISNTGSAAAGALTGINIGNASGAATGKTGINIGTGWDTGINLSAASGTTGINLSSTTGSTGFLDTIGSTTSSTTGMRVTLGGCSACGTDNLYSATVSSSLITSSGIVNIFNLDNIGTGPATGTLNAVNIGTITTPGAGTQTAINIGSGWNTGLKITGTTGQTTQNAVNVSGYSFNAGSGITSNLISLAFTDNSSSPGGSTTGIVNGINIASTINASNGSGLLTETTNAVNIAAPTITACPLAALSCNWNGVSANTSTTAAGTSLTTTGFYAQTNAINAGVVNGVWVSPSGTFNGATLTGVNIGNVNKSSGSATAISVGSGWDTALDNAATGNPLNIGNINASAASSSVNIAKATTNPLQALTTGTVYCTATGGNNYTMGYNFTPHTNGVITQLGAKVDSAAKVMYLYDQTSSTTLAGPIAVAAGVNTSNFTYVNITPIAVISSHTYTVTVYVNGTGTYCSAALPTGLTALPATAGDVTINGTWYTTNAFTPPPGGPPVWAGPFTFIFYGMADITFQPYGNNIATGVLSSQNGSINLGGSGQSVNAIGYTNIATGTTENIFNVGAINGVGLVGAAGNLNGVNISPLTAGAGTETAVNIGTGWDNGIFFNGALTNSITSAAATAINITTGTTGALTLDTSTTGNINIGTNTNAKTITSGSTTAATAFTFNSNATSANIITESFNGEQTGTAHTINVNGLTSGTGLLVNSAPIFTSAQTVSGNLLNLNRAISVNTGTTGPNVLGTPTTGSITNTTGTYNIPFTVSANSNRMLTVVFQISYSLGTMTGVQYAGVPMNCNIQGTYTKVDVCYLANPTSGTNNVTFTPAAAHNVAYVFTEYNNADTTAGGAPTTQFYSSSGGTGLTTGSQTIASSATDTVQDALAAFTCTGAAATLTGSGAGQTVIENISIAPAFCAEIMGVSSWKTGTAGSTTMSETWNNLQYWEYMLIAIHTAPVTLTQSLASITSNCSISTGLCTDSSNILNLAQNYSAATGTVLKISNSGYQNSATAGSLIDAILVPTVISGTANLISLTPSTVNGGTENALNLNSVTTTSGTSNAIKINGTGWTNQINGNGFLINGLGQISYTDNGSGVTTVCKNGGFLATCTAGSSTLQTAYNNSTNPATITLNSSQNGIIFTNPIGGTTSGQVLQINQNATSTPPVGLTINQNGANNALTLTSTLSALGAAALSTNESNSLSHTYSSGTVSDTSMALNVSASYVSSGTANVTVGGSLTGAEVLQASRNLTASSFMSTSANTPAFSFTDQISESGGFHISRTGNLFFIADCFQALGCAGGSGSTDSQNLLAVSQNYNGATGNLINATSSQTSGTLISVGANAATTPNGNLTGLSLNLQSSYTNNNGNFTVTGQTILLPNSSYGNAASITNRGLQISQTSATNSTSFGAATVDLIDLSMPTITTSNSANYTANGINIATTNSVSTTGSFADVNGILMQINAAAVPANHNLVGINLFPNGTFSAGGNVYGLNIQAMTYSSGTANAINIGTIGAPTTSSGWSTAINAAVDLGKSGIKLISDNTASPVGTATGGTNFTNTLNHFYNAGAGVLDTGIAENITYTVNTANFSGTATVGAANSGSVINASRNIICNVCAGVNTVANSSAFYFNDFIQNASGANTQKSANFFTIGDCIAGGCTGNITNSQTLLNLNEAYTVSTGTVLKITDAGTGLNSTTAGTLIDATITPTLTSGTVNLISLTPGTVNGATENALNINNITTISGTSNAINIGTGWNNSLNLQTVTSNTLQAANIVVGNQASTAQNNRTVLNLQNAGTGFFDLELVRGFVNNQGTNTFQDDFIGKQLDTTNRWNNATAETGATCSSTFATGVVNGVLQQVTSTNTAGAGCTLTTQATLGNSVFLQDNNPVFETSVKMGSFGTSQRAYFGFSASKPTGDTNNAIRHAYILKRAADSTWQCSVSNGTTDTVTAITGATISTTAYQRLRVQVQNGTTQQVICSVDNVTPVNVAATQPGTGNIMDILLRGESDGTASATNNIDYVRAWQDDPPQGSSATPVTIPTPVNNTSTLSQSGSVTLSYPTPDLISRADIAENYQATDGLRSEAGDLVSIASGQTVTLTTGSYDPKLLGIVSTSPYQTIGGDNFSGVVRVALSGRVPTKVSTENGPISVGDPLTSSSTPGVAMKATRAGPIIGKALEAYSNTPQAGKILVFVSNGYWAPPLATSQQTIVTDLIGANLNIASLTATTVTADTIVLGSNITFDRNGTLQIKGQLIVTGTIQLAGNLTINGNIDATSVAANEFKVKTVTNDPAPTAGVATIVAGTKELIINTTRVTADSLVFVTPTTQTAQQLAVVQKTAGTSFKVTIANNATADITFNWIIVNQQISP